MIPLIVLMFFMGVYPRVFLDRSRVAVEAVRTRIGREAGGSIVRVPAKQKPTEFVAGQKGSE
jgi:hypothetical protein